MTALNIILIIIFCVSLCLFIYVLSNPPLYKRDSIKYDKRNILDIELSYLKKQMELYEEIGYKQCSDIIRTGSFYEVEMRKELEYNEYGNRINKEVKIEK